MPTVRRLVATAVLAAVAAAGAAGPSAALEKKGVAINTRAADVGDRIESLGVGWYYTWGIDPVEGVEAEFVPMVWGDGPRSRERLETLAERDEPAMLLGFNEPDHDDQADMTVDEALALWPALEELSDTLISPAPIRPRGPWMREFMREADARGLDVDYVAVHWYGPPTAEGFLRVVDSVFAEYARPIWITEFSVADWPALRTGGSNRYTPTEVVCFLATVLPELERREHVVRYAWYGSPPREATRTSALFDETGELTPVGRFYAAFGEDGPPPEAPPECP